MGHKPFRENADETHACPDDALQILLDEAGTEVNIDLYERRITNRLETVDLAGLDDKDVASGAFESFAIHGPNSAAFTDELDLIVRMAVRTGSGTRLAMKKEYGNLGVTLLKPAKFK